MLKKVLSVSICLALVGALFTGCWWNDDDSSSSSQYNSSSTSMGMAPSTSMGTSSSTSMGASSGTSSSMGSDSMSTMPDTSSSTTSSSSSAVANASAGLSSWETILVNAKNPLPENFEVKTRQIKGYGERLFDSRASQDLEQMLADAEKAGLKLYLVSAYRSISRQKVLFNRKTEFYKGQGKNQIDAEAQAAKWVARPGTSEHNLGLAADIVSADWYSTNDDLTADFENTPHFAWLVQNCANYGFVVRYPKDKQEITGITYEPWHYRYVGKEAAKEIMEQKICLEEYAAKQ